MTKTILLTGGTDGIGFETAKLLVRAGHTLLLHGRNAAKLETAKAALSAEADRGVIETYQADLSDLSQVRDLAAAVKAAHGHLDVLINNAGVFKVPSSRTPDGHDVRFIVNMVAPYLLTKELLSLFPADGRVVNLSSAAQAPVSVAAFREKSSLSDGDAYAQSKLGITMWSFHLAKMVAETGPSIIAVNPGSFLGSKMVKAAYGSEGKDLSIGADVLFRAALGDQFANASGRYFDNDRGAFASPHPNALDARLNAELVAAIESVIAGSG